MTDSVPFPDPRTEPVIDVERAGRLVGLGRSASYEACRRGELPALKIGRRTMVVTAKLLALLGIDDDPTRAA